MEDYYEYLDSSGVTTLYKLIKDDTVALIDSYSVTLNGITTTLDNHVNNVDIHTPIADIEGMIDIAVGSLNYATPDYVDTKVADLVNSAPETLDTLKELSDALGNDSNFATTVVNQIGTKANKDDVYTKLETDTLLEGKANSVHNHVVSDITDMPTIPTKTSQLINDSGFLTGSNGLITSVSWSDITNKPNFSTVATSGSYNDLSNKPTIPTVNNATLTIQKNGTTVKTFTANSSTNVTCNIEIPTKVSDLTNDSGFIADVSGKADKATTLSGYGITDAYTKTQVDTKISDLVNSAPETLDTLNELANALGNDPNFATTVANQIGTKANTSDLSAVATSGSYNDLSNKPTIPNVYNKTLTIQKNGTNVAKFTSNSNTDVTADITVPTKVSELSNDSGFITGISWDKVTNKPTLATVATSGSYTDLSNTPTIPTKVSQLENDMGFGTGGDTSDCVHKTGDETIAGVKTFTSMLKISHGTLQVGSDTGYSVTYGWAGDITSKQPSGTYNIALPKANGTLALDDNLVHRTGNETIVGFKSFTEVLDRRNDVKTSTVATATQLVDINANRCGWIANRMHWSGNYHVHNRHIAYNENSGKEVYIDIISSNNGSGGLFVGGSVTNRNLYDITSETGHTALATMGWVNNPATSTNVVHRSGNEAISGAKIFLNDIFRKNTSVDLTVTPTGYTNTNIKFADKNDKTIAYFEFVQRPHGVNDVGIFACDKNGVAHGIHINTNNEVIPLMSSSESYSLGSTYYKWANAYIANTYTNRVTAYSITHPTDDSYFFMSGGTEWNKGANLFLYGYSLTGGNAGSFELVARNATQTRILTGYPNGTLQWAGQDIATTAWVRTYVNSVVGSGSVGASISAYYSNATTLTAEGSTADRNPIYPAVYSDYINIAPTVGTIYTGSQLFSSFTPTASGTIQGPTSSVALFRTTAHATATFSGAFSASAKYLCTTANAVKFRAYVSQGTSTAMGSPSVVDNSSAKSIFLRIQ